MHPILVSRTGRSAEQAFGYLVENCFRVIVAISADISVAEDAFYARVITGRDASLLFHAAGLLRDAILTRQTAGDIRVVAAPEVCCIFTSLSSVSRLIGDASRCICFVFVHCLIFWLYWSSALCSSKCIS